MKKMDNGSCRLAGASIHVGPSAEDDSLLWWPTSKIFPRGTHEGAQQGPVVTVEFRAWGKKRVSPNMQLQEFLEGVGGTRRRREKRGACSGV